MNSRSYTIAVTVNQTPEEAFAAINNVRGWWSESVEGSTEQLNDEFIYRYKDMHYSKQKLTELIPGKKVVWLVTDSTLSFLKKDKSEWTGTKIVFDISKQKDKTQITFKHVGLNSQCECFDACTDGWNYCLQNGLLKLINMGKGHPNKKENKLETTK